MISLMTDQAVGASSRRWLEVFGKSLPRITYNDQQLDTSCKCQVSDLGRVVRKPVNVNPGLNVN